MDLSACQRILCLDTSILNQLAQDYSSGNSKRVENVQGFINDLAKRQLTILLTAHHLMEQLSHGNSGTCQARISFLGSLQSVCWIASHQGVLGTVVDVLAREVASAQDHPALPLSKLRDLVRPTLFRCGTGASAIVEYAPYIAELKPYLQEHEKSAQETVALGPVIN